MPRKAKQGIPRGNDDQKEIGILIRKYREELGLTQEGLSTRMNRQVSAQLISRYENGGDHMRIGTYFAFVETFRVTPNDFCPLRLLLMTQRISTDYPYLTDEQKEMVDDIIRSFRNNPLEDSADIPQDLSPRGPAA